MRLLAKFQHIITSDGDGAGPARGATNIPRRPFRANAGTSGDGPEFSPEDFRAEAADLADRYEDENLDFSVDSLSRLDEVAAVQGEMLEVLGVEVEDEGFLARMESGDALQFGSYLGEVLIRAFDGYWEHDGDDWGVAVPVGDETVSVAVFDAAVRSVVDEPVFADVAQSLAESVEIVERANVAVADPNADFETQAVELAEVWPEHDLDFSPESLARLDDLVDTQWDKDRFRKIELGSDNHLDSLVLAGLVTQLGSYFGEVLVRQLDAEWSDDDPLVPTVAIAGDDGDTVSAKPFRIAEDCLTEPSKFAFTFDVLVERAGVDASRASTGRGETADEDDPATAPEPTTPETLASSFARAFPAYDLDFSHESLARLDDLATDVDADRRDRAANQFAAYVGEVFIRTYDAAWTRENDEWAIAVPDDGGGTNTVAVTTIVTESLDGGASFAAVHAAMAAELGVDTRNAEPSGEPAGATSDPDDEQAPVAAAGTDNGQATMTRPGSDARSDADTETATDEESADVDQRVRSAGETNQPVGRWYRELAALFAESSDDYELDFSIASLSRLDELVTDSGAEDRETVDNRFVAALAGYFGEVINRTHDAEWCSDADEPTVVVLGDGQSAKLQPVTLARTCVTGDATFVGIYRHVTDQLGLGDDGD